jgi:hypothetical protein
MTIETIVAIVNEAIKGINHNTPNLQHKLETDFEGGDKVAFEALNLARRCSFDGECRVVNGIELFEGSIVGTLNVDEKSFYLVLVDYSGQDDDNCPLFKNCGIYPRN